MSDGAAEAVATIAAEAVAEVGSRAAAAVTGVIAGAEAAVENAQARVADAQAVAQAVTDAALQNELGRQVAAVQEDMDEWESEIEGRLQTLQAMLTAQQEEIRAMAAAITELKTPIVLATVPTPEAASTSPISPEPEAATVAIVTPGASPAPIAAVPEVPVRKRNKWI